MWDLSMPDDKRYRRVRALVSELNLVELALREASEEVANFEQQHLGLSLWSKSEKFNQNMERTSIGTD
jgi:hypothetical protein